MMRIPPQGSIPHNQFSMQDMVFKAHLLQEDSEDHAQEHLHFLITQPFILNAVHNLKASLIFIITFNHFILHGWSTRNIYGNMISMCGAKDWNITN